MIEFEKFVEYLVDNWKTEKKLILENVGLSGLSNRQYGDKAEKYILGKVKSLTPKYQAYITKGSQTPADIISVARRNGYWHIMLIQVKSSKDKTSIYKLDKNDKKAFDEFAKFVKTCIDKFSSYSKYKDKLIVISTGYSGILRTENNSRISHRLVETKYFKIFKKNALGLKMNEIEEKIKVSHKL